MFFTADAAKELNANSERYEKPIVRLNTFCF